MADNVTTIAELQERRREKNRIGNFASPYDAEDIVVPMEMTADGERRVGIMAPPVGHKGWALTPDHAEDVAHQILREVAAARAGARV